MKKTLLQALFLLFALSASAQRKGFWVLPNAGIGNSIINDAEMYITMGAEASYMLTDKIGVGTGLNYFNYGQTGQESAINIPFLFRYISGTRGGFFLNTGIALNNYDSYTFEPFTIESILNLGYNMRLGNKVQAQAGAYISYHAQTEMALIGFKIGIGIHTFAK